MCRNQPLPRPVRSRLLRSRLLFCAFAVPALLAAQPAAASPESDWATASDIGVGALAAWSLGVPVAEGDTAGALQAGGSIAAGALVTQGLKEAFPEMRPDGSDNRSFPSGHTSMAFAAATSIMERRGSAEGIPALVLAGLVGVARIKADKHHWYDVGASTAIGIASGLLVTHPREARSVAMAWGDSHSIGVTYAARF